MKKIKNIKNRLSLSVDKLTPIRTRSPPSDRGGITRVISAPLSIENIPTSVYNPPSRPQRSPSPPIRPQRDKRTCSRSRPSSLARTPSVVEAISLRKEEERLAEGSPMSDSEVEKSNSQFDDSLDLSFDSFSKALSDNEPESLIDEVMKEVEKISSQAAISEKSDKRNPLNGNIKSDVSNKIDLSSSTTSNEDLGLAKSSDDTLNTETSASSSTSLVQEKKLYYRQSCQPPIESTFATISTSSTLHAESLTSGYFSDSEDTVNSDLKERQIRAKTASPIQRMFRIAKHDKEDTKVVSSSTEEKKDLPKKESIYSRLIKSTKRETSGTRSTKEPIYARIKPKLKVETSFKPIEPIALKEASTASDLLVKPEPIYSKIKPKNATCPQPEAQLPSSHVLSISSGSPSSPFTPVTPVPSDREPSKEPLYSSIKPKKEKTRTLPLESLYSKIKRRDVNTLPKESASPPKIKEPIYNQPLPALPFESQNNYKKYEFLSSSCSEPTYGKVLAVKAKELLAISPSKPSVITINNPGYAKTISSTVITPTTTAPTIFALVEPQRKTPPCVEPHSKTPPCVEPHSKTPPYVEPRSKIQLRSSSEENIPESLPQSPSEEVKSDMEESTTSLSPSSKDPMDMSLSNIGLEEGIKMDLGSTSKLNRLVEELAQELESVSQRTGNAHSVETRREVLNKILNTYDVPKNLRRVEEADEDDIRLAEKCLLRSSSENGLRYMDDDENMETVYADVPDYSQDEFVIALDDENDPKYASLTRSMRQKSRGGGESPGKVSRKSAQVYVNVVNVISALKVLINSNSTKAATVINKMGTLARPYAQKVHTSLSDNSTWIQRRLYHRSLGSSLPQCGHNGFDELRKYIKSGGEFCKELAIIMHERAELEATYAKGLHKLSSKLVKASRDSIGTISEAWQAVGAELEHEGDVHRILASSLTEDVVRPLRQVIETQHKIRKGVEGMVDKATKNLHDWRTAELKAKKNCYHNTRENEKIQDMVLESRLGRGKSLSDKEVVKMEKQRRKAEEAVQKSDVEYYSYCIRTERSRQEWESAVYKGSNCFQTLEEERLAALKDLILKYHKTTKESAPKLVSIAARLDEPVSLCNVEKDIQSVILAKGTGENIPEQFLPDFFSEDLNNAMNKARRREALEKFVKLIRSDLERERRGKQGVENLAKALQETPNFGGEESQQDVNDKLQNMKAMLAYLEAARYKAQTSLDEINSRPRTSHPLAKHIETHRDKQGLPVSILKVPPWVKGNSTDVSPMSESPTNGSPNWNDRGTADGNSVQPDSDFDSNVASVDAAATPLPIINPGAPADTALTSNDSSFVPPSIERDAPDAVPPFVPRAFMYPARYPSLILPTDEFSSQGSDPDYQSAVNDTGQPHQKILPPQGVESRGNVITAPDDQRDSGPGGGPLDGTYFARPLTTTGASLGRCKALYDYEANLYDELSIRTGDIINIHDKQPDGWWVGEVEGHVGIFPATYVEEID